MTSRDLALSHFKKVAPSFYEATLPHHSSLPARLAEKSSNQALFQSLVSIVVSQQLGTKAADSIFSRVKELCDGKITPEAALSIRASRFAAAGLSGAKIRTIKEIAKAVKKGDLNLMKLKKVPEAEASETLTALWGLGPWSVDMFMMFSLGRTDVFSPGDLGLARAVERLYGLPKNSPREKLLKIAETWSPYRTYACLLLWRYRDAVPQVLSPGRHR